MRLSSNLEHNERLSESGATVGMASRDAQTTVVTFGETMLRLSPPGYGRLARATLLDAHVGGTESNVACALAQLGTPVSWVSRLPENALGRLVEAQLRLAGVDTSGIRWSEDGRLGLYFVEHGSEPRPTRVLYDRQDSAFARLNPGEFDWPTILEGSRVFHTTGITLALGPGSRQALFDAAEAAREAAVLVSFDLNYRANLWSREQAERAYREVAPLVDVLFCSPAELARLLGTEAESPRDLILRSRDEWNLGRAILAVRAGESISYATLDDETELLESREYAPRAVERFGAGDAAAAAFLHSLVEGKDERYAVELAAAASALQHTLPGDIASFTLDELEDVARGQEGDLLR
jgi:2-dehydro-3-deoxygluconokinase